MGLQIVGVGGCRSTSDVFARWTLLLHQTGGRASQVQVLGAGAGRSGVEAGRVWEGLG
jgi:hypothetical protein